MTVLRLDPVDREFLLGNLDSLPGAGDDDAPVTIEGNGQVIVRSKAKDQPTPTEVVLARSQAQGKKVAVATNRHYLAHALRLGFAEISVVSTEQPASCRDEKRQYVWQILGKDAVVKASDEAIRLSSTRHPGRTTTCNEHRGTRRGIRPGDVQEPSIENSNPLATEADHAEVMNGSPERSGIAQVLAEAEAIKDLLRQAYTRTHQLVTGLKRYRKQAHVVQTFPQGAEAASARRSVKGRDRGPRSSALGGALGRHLQSARRSGRQADEVPAQWGRLLRS